eukprot:Sspe_Gene.37365::Locus_18031_Transcript_1_4_Confidence_0.500_Length_371::g.37365::m.37365
MSPQTMLYLIAFIALVTWGFQVAALADGEAYVVPKWKSYGDQSLSGCGVFSCSKNFSLVSHPCGEVSDHVKAAQGVGVVGVSFPRGNAMLRTAGAGHVLHHVH